MKTPLFKLNFLLLSLLLFLSCTQQDKHPDVPTLDELVSFGKIKVLEENTDDATTITIINDSMLFSSKKIYKEEKEQHSAGPNDKKDIRYELRKGFSIKNFESQKIYLVGEFTAKNNLQINAKGDVLFNDNIMSFPDHDKDWISTTAADKQNFTPFDDLPNFHNGKLPEFEDKIRYKWSNGKLPSPHYLYYYTIGGLKFKSTDECYMINRDKSYFHCPGKGLYKVVIVEK
jgi:hypothetical protein